MGGERDDVTRFGTETPARQYRVDADGVGIATLLPANGIPAQACGWAMQALDLTNCATTNTVTL